jgi:DAK2 domain fusion protein YloV
VDGLTRVQPNIASETLSGHGLHAALEASATWLERHAEAINALNVFPVPDGDTGLNLSLTLRSAVDAVPNPVPATIGEVGLCIARGALMGARGNSGVILAEFLRAAVGCLKDRPEADATLIAEALEAASQAAYQAVERPVEGTVLTVARDVATAARQAAQDSASIVHLFERTHEAAREAVARTPQQLDILRQASVVDAGGEGLRVILEGILRQLRGEPVDLGPARVEMRADLSSLHAEGDDRYGYCTEVLLQAAELDVADLRAQLHELGTCVVVVGDPNLLKIHVHTPHPGTVLNLATSMGNLVKVKIDNMQLQHEAFSRAGGGDGSARAADTTMLRSPQVSSHARTAGTTLLAVTIGTGFARLFESLGAIVVEGERTMNPSVEAILRGIDASQRDEVIVLPNDRNVLMTAEQSARQRPDRTVLILPTENLPRGVAAALALNPDASARENLPRLQAAADRCQVIEMTRAVRSAFLEDVSVGEGALLALLNGRFVATAETYPELASAALDRLPPGAYEIATIYPGAAALPSVTEELVAQIGQRLGVEVAVQAGGQPHYHYVIAIEVSSV